MNWVYMCVRSATNTRTHLNIVFQKWFEVNIDVNWDTLIVSSLSNVLG